LTFEIPLLREFQYYACRIFDISVCREFEGPHEMLIFYVTDETMLRDFVQSKTEVSITQLYNALGEK